MLLMVGKRIRRVICHAIYKYAKANDKYMKNYDKNKESLYLIYLDANNLYGGQYVKNYLQMLLKGKNTFKFDENFIKSYDEDRKEG